MVFVTAKIQLKFRSTTFSFRELKLICMEKIETRQDERGQVPSMIYSARPIGSPVITLSSLDNALQMWGRTNGQLYGKYVRIQ